MKNETSALIFPETAPSPHGMAKLLVFFDSLAYYLPTEADGPNSRQSNFFTNLCTGYAPAPLGNDLSRFNRLLRELESSRPDEITRLFAAAKTPGAAGQVRDQEETSAAGLYSALNQEAGAKAAIRHKERLWQARLILKLAEMLDRREAEVRQGLAQISSVEQKLFASLEGLGQAETDDPAELSSGPDKLLRSKSDGILLDEPAPAASGLLIPLRLKAWAELYLADSSDPHPMILATVSPESGGLLLDGFENTCRCEPKKLFSLAIPALHPADLNKTPDTYLAARHSFRAAAYENLEYFAGFLRETAASVGAAPDSRQEIPKLTENISAWEEQINAHFPGPGKNIPKLDFYCFPGISLAELLQHLFHLEGPAAANKHERPAGLLAILSP